MRGDIDQRSACDRLEMRRATESDTARGVLQEARVVSCCRPSCLPCPPPRGRPNDPLLEARTESRSRWRCVRYYRHFRLVGHNLNDDRASKPLLDLFNHLAMSFAGQIPWLVFVWLSEECTERSWGTFTVTRVTQSTTAVSILEDPVKHAVLLVTSEDCVGSALA